jgi:hypothetical protein
MSFATIRRRLNRVEKSIEKLKRNRSSSSCVSAWDVFLGMADWQELDANGKDTLQKMLEMADNFDPEECSIEKRIYAPLTLADSADVAVGSSEEKTI